MNLENRGKSDQDQAACKHHSGTSACAAPDKHPTTVVRVPAGNRRDSIRLRLASLVAACVLPAWLAAGFMLHYNYQSRLALINQGMLETARALTMVVDRELASMQASLGVLSNSRSLASGDLRAFYREAHTFAEAYPSSDVILADATGQQLINTYRPFGTPLPKRSISSAVQQVFATGKPFTSNVSRAALTRRFLISVDVPVFRDGRVVYDLAMTVPVSRFQTILLQGKLPPQWVGRILDRDLVILARTHSAERFVGRTINTAPGYLGQPMRESAEGTAKTISMDGTPMFNSFSRSQVSGWAVAIGVPKAVVMGEIWRRLSWGVLVAALLAMTGVLTALPIARSVEQVQRRSHRLKTLVESSDDAIIGFGLDGIITIWNPGAERLFGYSQAEIVGRHVSVLVPDDELQGLPDRLRRVCNWEVVEQSRTTRKHKNGMAIPVSVKMSPVPDHLGAVVGVSLIARDITRLEKAEEALERSNSILSQINRVLHSALSCETEEALGRVCLEIAEKITESRCGFIGYITKDGLEEIVFSNPGWEACSAFGSSVHHGPPGTLKIQGIYGRVLADGKSLFTNDPANHPDSVGFPGGHPPLQSFLGVPIVHEGRVMGMIAVGNREGGYSRKEQESLEALMPSVVEAFMRKRAEKALRDSEDRLQLASRAAGFGTYRYDFESGVGDWSQELKALWGLRNDDPVPLETDTLLLGLPHPEDRHRLLEAMSWANDPRSDGRLELDYRVVWHDGSVRWLHVCGRTEFAGEGEHRRPWRAAGAVADITDIKKAEESLKTARAELAHSARIANLGELTASIAHEINQPLAATVINGGALVRWLDAEPPNLRKAQEAAERIIEDATRASRVISRMRSLVRKTPLEMTPVDVNDAIRQVLSLIQNELTNGRVEVQTELADIPAVLGDHVQLQQVMLNLILNAMDAMSAVYDRQRRLVVRSACNRGQVEVQVEDSGIGLDPQQEDRIFEPFFTTKPHGVGLGLSISRSIIETHGGQLWAASAHFRGAIFSFSLPQLRDSNG